MTTDPTPIAPPLEPAPPSDRAVAHLVHELGVDTLCAIADGAEFGRNTHASDWSRDDTASQAGFVGPVYRAAALAAYDEASGR